MNNNPFRSRIFILLFTFFSVFLSAQTNTEKKSLIAILNSLEETYGYKFTYANDVVEGIVIHEPPKGMSFREIIRYLEEESSLLFKFLENNFIAINRKDDPSFVCGYVIDREYGIPLINVAVQSNSTHTITDEFGYFKLKVNGNETINFRHIGFNPISKPASSFDAIDCTNVYLKPQIETLSEVVLSSFIAKGIDKIADGSFTIDFSNFGIVPGLIETDVLQTVQALPGIQSVDETVSNINIRGGTHDQNLIRWDGIKMYQSGHFFGLISMFNPQITNDVTLIKNGTDADLSDGVSGTIDMRTDKHINTDFNGSIGLNLINADVFFDIPLGPKSSIQLAGRKSINELTQTPTYERYYDRIIQDTELTDATNNNSIGFDFYDASARWLYSISQKDQLQLNFILVENQLDAFNSSINSSLNQNSLGTGLRYKRNWSDKFITEIQAYQTLYELEASNDYFTRPQLFIQKNNVSEYAVKLKSWYQLNPQFIWLNGYQYTDTGIEERTTNDNPVVNIKDIDIIQEHALYTQVNFTSDSKNTTLKAGVRYNYVTLDYSSEADFTKQHLIEPRLSINHKFLKDFSIEVLGEMKHQNTTQIIRQIRGDQNDFFGIEKRKWLAANGNDVGLITSKQASIGLNFDRNGWLINADAYFKEIDGINSLSQGFLNQYENISASGSYKVIGSDLLINKKINKISAWLSYSIAENDYTFEKFEEQSFPSNLDIRHTITMGSSYTTNNLKLAAGFNYHSGIPATLPLSGNEITDSEINFEEANSSRLDNYIRMDVSATYNFTISKKIKGKAGVSVWNVLDQKNTISNYYQVINNEVVEITKDALAVTPNITLRISF